MTDIDPTCAKCGRKRSEHNVRHPFVGPTQADIIAALTAERDALKAKLTMKQAECDGFSSMLLSVQQDCIALQVKLDRAVKGLTSIAANTCCDGCLEASKVARATLKEIQKGV